LKEWIYNKPTTQQSTYFKFGLAIACNIGY
jgi:hypothetical protein